MSVTNVGQPGINSAAGAEVAGTSGAKKPGRSQPAKAGGEAAKSASTSGATNAEISERGREVAKAKTTAVSAPEVREAKIAELKSRIEAGKYKVDADAVADRMVNDHLEMSGMS